MPASQDVLVVGGGVIGCAIGWRLAQAGLGVTLLERGQCGRECSWAGAGILDAGSFARSDPLAGLRRLSVARWPRFVDELRERSGIDPQFLRCGGLDLITDDNQDAAADREVAAAAGLTTPAGEPLVERLTVEQTLEREPQLRAEIRGALLVRDVSQVRNPRLLEALRVACAHAGVRILEHTPAIELVVEDARVVGVRTPGGRLSGDRIVLAAGSWSSQLSPRLAGLVEVHPVRGQIVLLERLPPLLNQVILCGRRYLVCRADGKVLVGTTDEPDAGFDQRNTLAAVRKLTQFAERCAPMLKDATLVRTWAGLRPGTPDGKPYLGPVPGLDGLIAATGHFRSGLTLTPITADLMVELIARGQTEIDLTPFLPGRPPRADCSQSDRLNRLLD